MANHSQIPNDQGQTMLAVAALFAALVRALRAQDDDLPSRFAFELERLFHKIRDDPDMPDETLEALRWANRFLRD
jgi:hypothetical protein